jgi:hypothetical protein
MEISEVGSWRIAINVSLFEAFYVLEFGGADLGERACQIIARVSIIDLMKTPFCLSIAKLG